MNITSSIKETSHLFALYIGDVIFKTTKDTLHTTDKALNVRIKKVLRLREYDHCIFFDKKKVYYTTIVSIYENELIAKIQLSNEIILARPKITLLLPLLGSEQMEVAFYAAAQHGVEKIQVIQWKKSQSSWGKSNDFMRAQRIMIAACEQSKSFSIPQISQAILKDISSLQINKNELLVVDCWGENAQKIIPRLSSIEYLYLCIGPEGGFTATEEAILNTESNIAMRLTPKILRSCDAIALSLGMVRSFMPE